MDKLELKIYNLINEQKSLLLSKKVGFLSKLKNALNPFKTKSQFNRPQSFFEYYINGIALSDKLNELNKFGQNTLDQWIGALGSFKPSQYELNHLKRMMLQPLSEDEIRSVFSSELDPISLDNSLVRYQEELNDTDILLYVCIECGDYACNGIKVKIQEENDCITWTLQHKGLKFRFDKDEYIVTLKAYQNEVLMKFSQRKHKN